MFEQLKDVIKKPVHDSYLEKGHMTLCQAIHNRKESLRSTRNTDTINGEMFIRTDIYLLLHISKVVFVHENRVCAIFF